MQMRFEGAVSGEGYPTGGRLNSQRTSGPYRVVTLGFLSERISQRVISARLAQALAAETQESVVLVRLERQAEMRRGHNGGDPPASLNGEFRMPEWLPLTEGGVASLAMGVGVEPPTPEGIDSLISQLRRHFQYVLIAAPAGGDLPAWLVELMVRSDLVYLFMEASQAGKHRLDGSFQARCGVSGAKVKAVACAGEGEPPEGCQTQQTCATSPVDWFVRDYPTGSDQAEETPSAGTANRFSQDVRRLAREVSGRLVGLALSSGAAKGFAHVGVIQVLEEHGIEVDVVAGASMGAYVGALWAYGCDGSELERLSRDLEKRRALWSLVDPAFPPRQGFLRGYAVKRRLMQTLGEARFGDLVRPLRVLAANLTTLERVVFSIGEVATAVHASVAVPGICVPVTIDRETYVDGGIVDPLPVDVLREMGVARVIAVDVIPTPDRIRAALEAKRSAARHIGARRRGLWSSVRGLERNLNYFARGNLFEILMRSVRGAQIRVAEASGAMADLVLRPASCDDTWSDYRNPGRFILLGRESAERHLEEIKALVWGKAPCAEPRSAQSMVPKNA